MAKKKVGPVPLSKLRFEGDAQFILVRLKRELAERDSHIEALENKTAMLDRCADRVFHALEEAEGMASNFERIVADAQNDASAYKRGVMEFQRYSRMFHEAKGDWQRIRHA
jgi:hypothetical protein